MLTQKFREEFRLAKGGGLAFGGGGVAKRGSHWELPSLFLRSSRAYNSGFSRLLHRQMDMPRASQLNEFQNRYVECGIHACAFGIHGTSPALCGQLDGKVVRLVIACWHSGSIGIPRRHLQSTPRNVECSSHPLYML